MKHLVPIDGGAIYIQSRMGKYSSPMINPRATPASLSRSSSSHQPSNGGWASLPYDLLALIFDKLFNKSVYDYIRCATVCESWFRHCLQHYESRRTIHHQLPLLFIPTNRNLRTRIPSVYNVTSKEVCGSSHGWLIFADTKRRALTLTLFNPFTAATIRLPPLLEKYAIEKVVLSDDPSTSNYEVLVLQLHGKLALFTSNRWIYDENYFDCSGFSFKDDHIFHMNRKFYALISGKLGTIEIVDCNEEDDTRGSYVRLEGSVNEIYLESWCQSYLAESIRGTLLFVQKFRSGGPVRVSAPFRVYEIEEGEEESEEGLVKRFVPNLIGGENGNLGDQALFIGPFTDSVCVRASDFAGCKPNSIYFIADTFKPVELGLYTLGDHDTKPLYELKPHLPRPVWIQPTPNLTSFVKLDEII